jgi:acetate---CoA ligase (ADP-forming) subunit beta
MLSTATKRILEASRERGWVLEPDAKQILRENGLRVPDYRYATTAEEALRAAADIGYPLVAKVVSFSVLHKSDVGGVAVGIDSEQALEAAFSRFGRIDGFSGMLVEEMADGLELIVGAKIDFQFGPVILLGLGGTGVEIYQDVAIRMAPLTPADVHAMTDSLKGRRLLEGYRGAAAVNMEALERTLIGFADLVVEMQAFIESVDLNPVICSADTCVIADARIMVRRRA